MTHSGTGWKIEIATAPGRIWARVLYKELQRQGNATRPPLQLTFVDGAAVFVGVAIWVCERDDEGACEREGLGVVVLLGDRLSDADIGPDEEAEAACEGLCEASLEPDGLADRELVNEGVVVAELLGRRDAEGSVVRL